MSKIAFIDLPPEEQAHARSFFRWTSPIGMAAAVTSIFTAPAEMAGWVPRGTTALGLCVGSGLFFLANANQTYATHRVAGNSRLKSVGLTLREVFHDAAQPLKNPLATAAVITPLLTAGGIQPLVDYFKQDFQNSREQLRAYHASLPFLSPHTPLITTIHHDPAGGEDTTQTSTVGDLFCYPRSGTVVAKVNKKDYRVNCDEPKPAAD